MESPSGRPGSWRERWLLLLARPTSGLSLGAFRACVGLVFALAARSMFGASSGHDVGVLLSGDWLVPFAGLEWVRPFPQPWMSVEAAVLGVAGLALMAGLASRASALACAFLWTHVWLCDATSFNNHYYLLSLLGLLLAAMPCGRRLSVDAGLSGDEPAPVPAWTILLLRAQLAVVYVFGAVTKMTFDYVVRGEPVRYFLEKARLFSSLQGKVSPETLEGLRALLRSEAVVRFVSWSGLLFDLLLCPMLLWRRTRVLAIVLCFAFHAFNHFVLFDDIGVFPLLGALSTLVFLDADWPATVVRRVLRRRLRPDAAGPAVPSVGAFTRALVLAYLVVQLVLPLRPWLIRGDADRSAEGTLFSWRMKNSVRARDLQSVIVRDASLVVSEGGREDVDWRKWTGARFVLRHASSAAVPWEDLPAVVVVREPVVGERLVINGASREPPPEVDAALLVEAAPFADWLARLREASAGAEPSVRALLLGLEAQVRSLQDPGLDETERFTRARRVRQGLSALRRVPGIGDAVLASLEASEPFSAWGAPPDARLALVALPGTGSGGFHLLDRPSLPVAPSEDLVVDLRLFDQQELMTFARETPLRMPDGSIAFWWSVPADAIGRERANWIAVYPQCLQLYARRVADLWQDAHGARPEVRGRLYVRVNRGEPFLLTDPRADLAVEPVRLLSHAPWILPPDDYPPAPGESLSY